MREPRCPECGADLTERDAVAIGVRRRRAGWLSVGLLLLLIGLGLPILGAIARAREFNWLPYEPTSWVLAQAKPPTRSAAAISELRQRALAGHIRDSQIGPVVAAALSEETAARAAKTWQVSWGQILEALDVAGRLPEQDWDRYLDLVVTPTITVKHRVDVARPPVFNIKFDSLWQKSGLNIEAKWNVRSITVNDRAIAFPQIFGTFDLDGSTTGSAQTGTDLSAPMSLGAKHMVVVIDGDETIGPGSLALAQPTSRQRCCWSQVSWACEAIYTRGCR